MSYLPDSRWFMANICEPDRVKTVVPDYRRNRNSVWAGCLALSLGLHLALLAAFPGSIETREAYKVRVLDVVIMPETPVPALAPAPRPATPPRTSNAAQLLKIPVRRESTPAPRPALNSGSAKPPVITAAEPASVPEPLAATDNSAKPDNTRPGSPRKSQDVQTERMASDSSAPSFNAAYLRNPAPRYPIIARRNGEQGTVTLKVLVTREGAPAKVSVDKTSGSAHLDAAALETVRSWRFVPARQGMQPVEAWVLVPIVFRLEPVS